MKFKPILGWALLAGTLLVAADGSEPNGPNGALPGGQQPLRWAYPPAQRGPVVDDYHGAKVADPYRWLEDLDSPQTRAWVGSENRLARGFLDSLPDRKAIRRRLSRLWNYPRVWVPVEEAGRYFFTRNAGLQNQPVLWVQDGLMGEPRVLLDLNTLSADGTVALAGLAVSHDGRRVAYETAEAGSDWMTFRVRDVDTGRDTGDVIRWVKFSEPSWTRDGAGFFYSRFPEPGPAGVPATFGALAHERVYYHRLGTPQAADRPIFEVPDHPGWLVDAAVTDDGRYAVLTVEQGNSDDTLLSYLPLGDPLAPDLAARAVPIIGDWEAETEVIGSAGSTLYACTDLGAPRRRIVAIDTRNPDKSHWRTVVPEGPDTLQSAVLAGGKIAALFLHNAASRLGVSTLGGRPLGDIPLPGLGTVGKVSGRPDSPELFYSYASFTRPSTVFRYDLGERRGAAWQAPQVNFDPAAYVTEQVFIRSKDGTRVPVFITRRRGVRPSASTPALLYGYGGFDIALTPSFSVPTLVWLEMGGIYVQPNLRGGGEYGRAWHEAGTKERKQNVFDDFIATAEWLFANGCSSPSRLVISGQSNGGLLIGAVLNQRPDLCRVAWPGVGVMDMLRFQKFTIGWAWEADYGSSDDPAGFRVLRAYSPLHTIRPGAHYPAILVSTADHDDRVYPAHSFKYAAQLQASAYDGPGALPVLLRIETRAGHGAGEPISKLIDTAADQLAFAAHFLGMRPNF